ncbi:hypothetical protein V865_000635 [Kwoniella europaea PYCC6329]|uniref:Uncharacterized protein n=1 Tax=Kwoniella europaea PYCC6329 TaxID=1423913 RepID=A0AAX4KAC7_9TREE
MSTEKASSPSTQTSYTPFNDDLPDRSTIYCTAYYSSQESLVVAPSWGYSNALYSDVAAHAEFESFLQKVWDDTNKMYGKDPDRRMLANLSQDSINADLKTRLAILQMYDERSQKIQEGLWASVQALDPSEYKEVSSLFEHMAKHSGVDEKNNVIENAKTFKGYLCPIQQEVPVGSTSFLGKSTTSMKTLITDYAICQNIRFTPTDDNLQCVQSFAEHVRLRFPLGQSSPSIAQLRDLAEGFENMPKEDTQIQVTFLSEANTGATGMLLLDVDHTDIDFPSLAPSGQEFEVNADHSSA